MKFKEKNITLKFSCNEINLKSNLLTLFSKGSRKLKLKENPENVKESFLNQFNMYDFIIYSKCKFLGVRGKGKFNTQVCET